MIHVISSKEQFEMVEEAGKDLVLTPIGKEAFVFFINEEKVDDVYPDTETIRSGEYPLSTQLYDITVRNAHPGGTYYEDIIEPFLEWMTGPQGQRIVADTGYVSLE